MDSLWLLQNVRKKTPFIQKKHSNTYSISAGHNDFIDEKYASQGSIQKPEENGSETGARKTVSKVLGRFQSNKTGRRY